MCIYFQVGKAVWEAAMALQKVYKSLIVTKHFNLLSWISFDYNVRMYIIYAVCNIHSDCIFIIFEAFHICDFHHIPFHHLHPSLSLWSAHPASLFAQVTHAPVSMSNNIYNKYRRRNLKRSPGKINLPIWWTPCLQFWVSTRHKSWCISFLPTPKVWEMNSRCEMKKSGNVSRLQSGVYVRSCCVQ